MIEDKTWVMEHKHDSILGDMYIWYQHLSASTPHYTQPANNSPLSMPCAPSLIAASKLASVFSGNLAEAYTNNESERKAAIRDTKLILTPRWPQQSGHATSPFWAESSDSQRIYDDCLPGNGRPVGFFPLDSRLSTWDDILTMQRLSINGYRVETCERGANKNKRSKRTIPSDRGPTIYCRQRLPRTQAEIIS